mgnify:CR=1 FL=1
MVKRHNRLLVAFHIVTDAVLGMVAFIVDVPKGFTEAATVLPVQIFLWSDLPEIAFQSRTAAAIIVLLVILFGLNAAAIYMRKRFERRW